MTALIDKAKRFAIEAHGDQKYGKHPYEYHLRKATRVIDKFFFGEKEYLIVCTWLHDTIEDSDVTFRDVFDEFGRNIARIVYAVTDEPGKSRQERHERTYPKLIAAGYEAIAVKLADRIANVENSLKYNHDLFKMYRKEYRGFRDALRLPGELKDMWAHLDNLISSDLEN